MTPPTQGQTRPKELISAFQRRPRWWREVIYCGFLYAVYSLVRNLQGSAVSVEAAKANAVQIVRIERELFIFNELEIQQFFLPATWFIKFLNVWYGTAHFVVTIGVLVWLFFRTENYRHWRNVIFAGTGLALIGYMTYPLAPPRLLEPGFAFEDTLQTVGGLWSFRSETIESVSNQYAAMPSLHVTWSLWCALAVASALRRAWYRPLVFLYPALTILAIVVTANHYWLDVVGGAAALGAGYMVAEVARKRGANLEHTLPEDDLNLEEVAQRN